MKSRGGARKGAGRKKKAEELSLLDTMDAYMAPKDFWKGVAFKCKEGDSSAQKLWASYRFGLPKQVIDQNVNLLKPIIIDWSGEEK